MARNLSPFLTALFEQANITGERVYNTQVAMEITLQNDSAFNVATADMTISSLSKKGASITLDTPLNFTSRLMNPGAITHEQGSNPDAGTQTLTNLDFLVGQLIPNPSRLFSGASVTIYLCFPKDDGTYEGLIYFIGKNRATGADDDNATFQLVSDLSDQVITLGEEITQTCTHELGDINCGAQHLPDGAVCSFIYDDAEGGCAFYGQQHAHSGVPFLNPNENVGGFTGVDPSIFNGGNGLIDQNLNGWDTAYVGGGCVDLSAFVETLDGWQRITQLKAGDELIDHVGRIGLIEKLEVKFVEFRYFISNSNGAELICSADHPVIRNFNDEFGKPLHSLNPESIDDDKTLITRINGKTIISGTFSITPLGPGEVCKISMSGETRCYSAGMKRGKGITGHNQKSIYRDVAISSYFAY